MQNHNNHRKVWDEVYQRISAHKLPWHGLPFLSKVESFIKRVDKTNLIIVPGCGIGETVEQLVANGHKNVIGTDISSVAIAKAQTRFPAGRFYCMPTEELAQRAEFRNAKVIDWINLHQISPDNLQDYLTSLENISSSLFIAYFYDSARPDSQRSIVTGELVYNHNPALITRLLNNMQKTSESVFHTGINKKFENPNQKWRTVAQVYKKRASK